MKNRFKTIIYLTLFMGILMLVGGWLGGQMGLIMAFVFALVTNFSAYWFSDKIVLRMHRAQPVNPEHPLYEMVKRLSDRARIPTPKVYLLPIPGYNAFATGRNPSHAAVAVTQGLYESLNEDELEGVVAHELAHIKHYDTLIMMVAATLASTLMFVINMAKWAAIFGIGRADDEGPGLLEVLALTIIGPLVALLIQSAISRSREFLADGGAAKITGSPYGLARALAKLERFNEQSHGTLTSPQTAHLFIVNPLFGNNVVTKLFCTHPPIQARIETLLGKEQARTIQL